MIPAIKNKPAKIINPVAKTADGNLSIKPVLANSAITGNPIISPTKNKKKAKIEKNTNGL